MWPEDDALRRMYAYPDVDRPWVRTNFVSTLDGAAFSKDGTSGAFGGDIDTHVFGILRSLADVVVVGAGTARAEGYGPSSLPIAVVSRSLDIPDALLVPGQIVITTADAPAEEVARLGDVVDVIGVGRDEIDWSAALDELQARGLRRILCEGGPSLHGDLIGLDLVDEVCLTVAPVLAAGSAPRIAHSTNALDRPMHLGHVLDVDGVVLTRWVRDRT